MLFCLRSNLFKLAQFPKKQLRMLLILLLQLQTVLNISNAIMRPKIEAICLGEGYEPTIICTPEELMEPYYENHDD